MQRDAFDRGRQLEAEIARILEGAGYSTQRNLIREGRSGGRHEIDVFAEKSDGLTTFSVVAECKAWNTAINKDVIAKASYVARDLGASKTIVVSLDGATLEAQRAASELGVEVWGPEELERHLGRAGLTALAVGPPRVTAQGFTRIVGDDEMRSALERNRSKGVLGVAAETMTVCRSLWLPCLLMEVGCSRVDGVLRKRTKHTSIFNLYEGLTGRLIGSTESPPALAEVDIGAAHLPRQVKSRVFRVEAERAFMKWRSAVQDGARQRRAAVLAQLGIPLPNDAVTLTEIAQPYLPIGVAVLEGRGKRRVQVIGLRSRRRSDLLSTVLTANMLILGDVLAA